MTLLHKVEKKIGENLEVNVSRSAHYEAGLSVQTDSKNDESRAAASSAEEG